MSASKGKFGDQAGASVVTRPDSHGGIMVKGVWDVVCTGPDGEVKWEERNLKNLVVTEGLDYLIDVGLCNSVTDSQVTTWYIGLKDTGSPAAGWTLAAGPTDITSAVTGSANRVAWVANGAPSSGSVSNSSSTADFSCTATDTVFGVFLASVQTGTAGLLYSAVDFAASRDVNNGDTLSVTYTFSAADDAV